MAVSETALVQLWRRICSALDLEAPEQGTDGRFRLNFVDGLEVEVWLWRDEAVFSGLIAAYDGDNFQRESIARRFLAIGLAKAGEWPECPYADQEGFHLWRRFADEGDEDFSIGGFEKFLNRLDFWRRQGAQVENAARRQGGGGGAFIAFDQFG